MQFKNSYRLSKDLDYIRHNYGKDKECIEEAIVSKEGFSFYPSSLHLQPVEKLKHLNELWNQEHFNEINLPIVIGHLNQENNYAFSFRNNIRILDMPIKFPHSDEFRCPKELAQFEDIIQQISSYEEAMNPDIDNYYCYITIDQRIVNKGSHTRRGGLHVDGFQGERIKEPLPIDHSYLIYDVAPFLRT